MMALETLDHPLHAADRSAELLFSTQFFISSVKVRIGDENDLQTSDVLVGFQLLQFEIVLFDAAGAHNAVSTSDPRTLNPADAEDPMLLQLQHGKSCLFQADPDRLALDLERESDAPLALLVMRREQGRVRLVAFASVPLDLHVRLLDEKRMEDDGISDNDTSEDPRRDTVGRIVSKDMRFRVCEWASSSGSWELQDHTNRVVGRATGAVTLSCLGRALAPHITKAIGLHVESIEAATLQAESSFKRPERDHGASAGPNQGRIDNRASETLEKETTEISKCDKSELDGLRAAVPDIVPAAPVTAKNDIAVQCGDDYYVHGVDSSAARTMIASPTVSLRANLGVHPAIRIDGKPSRSSRSQADDVHRHRRSETRPTPPTGSSMRGVVLHSDLPPPLFFQKPKTKQTK